MDTKFIVAGTYYHEEAIEDVAVESFMWDLTAKEKKEEFGDGDRLYRFERDLEDVAVVPEPDNPKDPNAIRVEVKGELVGYISAKQTGEVKKILDEGKYPYIKAELSGGPFIDFEEDDDGKLHINHGKYDYRIVLEFMDHAPHANVKEFAAAPTRPAQATFQTPAPDPKAEKKAKATQRWLLILAIICTVGLIVMDGAWRIIYAVVAIICWVFWFKNRKRGDKS